jgi:hypothetical protein
MANIILTDEKIFSSIMLIRNQKVMIDSDLAVLYGVETKRLNEQVKRNIERFPKDFMFQLSDKEWSNLKSQFATSKKENLKSQISTSNWGGRRTNPYVFTEQGVAMLSSVLNSDQAIKVNIAIMRVFVKIRQFAANYKELLEKIDELQKVDSEQNKHINNIYKIIEELVKPESKNKNPIGF